MEILTRLKRLGVLSLLALFIGGTIILLVGANTLAGTDANTPSKDWNARQFEVGSSWSVQAWLAVLGVGFGCISYGIMEAWTHLFNWMSSRSAASPEGLDYGRYLNSQHDAPISVGWRGFRSAISFKYFLLVLGLAATIGYKFTVVQLPLNVLDELTEEEVMLSIPAFTGLDESGATPLLVDVPGGPNNRAYLHLGRSDHMDGPEQIIMVGAANCSGSFKTLDKGTLVTREVVMVGQRFKPAGNFWMYANHVGYQRQRTVGDDTGAWTNSTLGHAIVDYNTMGPGSIVMQWTDWFSDWDTCSSASSDCSTTPHRVLARLVYNFTYATAEVKRDVKFGSCATLNDIQDAISLLSFRDPNQRFETEYNDGSLSLYRNWVDSVIYNRGSVPLEGVSIFSRIVMAGWAKDAVNITGAPRLGHAHGQPFGQESLPPSVSTSTPDSSGSRTEASGSGQPAYPYFQGMRDSASTGCYTAAAYLFIALGLCTYLIAVVRIAVGPPRLTSWMGQHIYLHQHQLGPQDQRASLASGYDAAPVDRIFVRLNSQNLAAPDQYHILDAQNLASPHQYHLKPSLSVFQVHPITLN